MNKLFTKIVGAALALTMAIGVGVAVASIGKTVEEVRAAEAGPDSDGYYYDTFTSGTFSTDHITWSMASGNVTLTQYKGTSGTAVNSSYATAARVYKGHYLAFEASGDYKIHKIEITVDGTYYGNSMTAGTAVSSNTVTNNTTAVDRTWTTTSGGTHVISSVSSDGLSAIYIQNVASTNVQLRWTSGGVKVFYTKGGGSDPVSVTGVSLNKNSTTINVGDTETLTATVSPNDATNKSVTWKSYSDSACTTESNAVASVSSGGLVTGVSAGTAYIQVKTADGNFTAKCTVTVTTPSYTDTYNLDGETRAVMASGGAYIPKTIGTSGRASVTTSSSDAALFLFEIVGNDQFTLKLTNGTNSGKYLTCTASTGGSSVTKVDTSAMNWTVETEDGDIHLKDTNSHYLAAYGTTDWRMYANTANGDPILSFPTISTDPAITEVSLTGSPAASSSIGGGNHWGMTATVTAINDDGESLSRNVNWTVSPAGAVTFSKNPSASGEEITVTAVNTANNNVVITASSAATGFTTVHADSNSFNIIKSYNVSSVSLSATTAGGPTYDANGASSFVVGFTTAVNYSGDAGTSKVNITVSPTAGVSGYGDNVTAGNFNLTFTKNGTYTVTSTSVENNEKTANTSVTINNIVVPGYELVNSTGSLRNGAHLVIHSTGTTYKMIMTTQGSGYRNVASYTVSNDFIPTADLPANTELITLVKSGVNWELKTSDNKYLALNTNGNNLYTLDDPDTTNNYTEWSISFSGNDALINSVAFPARYIELNGGSNRFACYTGTSQKPQLYVLVENTPYFSISDSHVYLGTRGTHTLSLSAHNGASDTVTWSTSDSAVASIPNNSTGTSVVVTGKSVGTATITATFGHPATYEALTCEIQVLALNPYVNLGVTTFTKTSSKTNGSWAGTYLIGDQSAKTILDGSLSPLPGAGSNFVTLDTLGDSVSATHEMISKSFTIAETETSGVYTIRSNSYFYIGNTSAGNNNMDTSIGTAYEVTISDAGVISMNSTTLAYNSGSGSTYRFYKDSSLSATIRAVALWRADGEVREITNTLAAWYDNAKANDYLVCNESGSGSDIDWDNLYDSAIDDLTSDDLDTLKRMSSKSAEDNGNYLEDFISDYDYLVQFKSYDDFLDRFAEGGAMYGTARVVPNSLLNAIGENTNTVAIIVVISMVSVTAIGGYFFLKKRREQN